jgi:MFS family permease
LVEEKKLGYVDKIRLFGRDARLFIVSASLGAFAFGISNVIFNLYMVQHFTPDFLGLFLSVSMFATATIAIGAGMITDRRSRKNIIVVASLLGNIAIALQYSVLDPILLIASQIILGLTQAFNRVAWAPFITDLASDEERAHLFAFQSGFQLLAILFGNITGGFLPGLFDTWFSLGGNLSVAYQFTLWVALIPMFVATFLILPMRKDIPDCEVRRISISHVKSWKFIGQYTASISIVGLGAGMIVMFFNLYFNGVFMVDTELMGIIFGINTVVLATGNFIAPALSDRFGKVKTVIITDSLSIPFLLMLSWAPYLYIGVIAYVMRSVLMNMAGPVQVSFFMEGLTKEERATAMGVVGTGDSLVRGVASNIGGIMLAAGLYREPYMLVSGLYIVGIALFYIFFKSKEKELELLKEAALEMEDGTELDLDAT